MRYSEYIFDNINEQMIFVDYIFDLSKQLTKYKPVCRPNKQTLSAMETIDTSDVSMMENGMPANSSPPVVSVNKGDLSGHAEEHLFCQPSFVLFIMARHPFLRRCLPWDGCSLTSEIVFLLSFRLSLIPSSYSDHCPYHNHRRPQEPPDAIDSTSWAYSVLPPSLSLLV